MSLISSNSGEPCKKIIFPFTKSALFFLRNIMEKCRLRCFYLKIHSFFGQGNIFVPEVVPEVLAKYSGFSWPKNILSPCFTFFLQKVLGLRSQRFSHFSENLLPILFPKSYAEVRKVFFRIF